jgi:hypothetical protein
MLLAQGCSPHGLPNLSRFLVTWLTLPGDTWISLMVKDVLRVFPHLFHMLTVTLGRGTGNLLTKEMLGRIHERMMNACLTLLNSIPLTPINQ